MHRTVAALLIASVGLLAGGGALAGKRLSSGAELTLQIDITGATDVVIRDELGRIAPCDDSTCVPIPRASRIPVVGVHLADSTFKSKSTCLVRIGSPGPGEYRISGIGEGQFMTVGADVIGPRERCGRIDGVDTQEGRCYEWTLTWSPLVSPPGCRVRLSRK